MVLYIGLPNEKIEMNVINLVTNIIFVNKYKTVYGLAKVVRRMVYLTNRNVHI